LRAEIEDSSCRGQLRELGGGQLLRGGHLSSLLFLDEKAEAAGLHKTAL